jgi:short-subunit dehydrogenase
MAQAYRDRFDAPEVLINNAGYAVYYTFDHMPSEEINRLIDVNLVGAALVTREFLTSMIGAGGGRIVMMASIAGRIPITPCSVYGASKHALVALADLLRIETSRFNMKVHVVCPGRVETDFFSHHSFKFGFSGPRLRGRFLSKP